MKRQGFIKGSAILLAMVLITKILGLLYKIPLTNLLGGTGMGYFASAFSVFTPVFAIVVSGIPSTMARLTAENYALERFSNMRHTKRTAFFLFTIISAAAAAVMILTLDFLSRNVVGEPSTKYALMCVAPSIIFCTIMSVERGYCEGLQNMIPTAVSEVIETLFKLILGLGFAYGLMYHISDIYPRFVHSLCDRLSVYSHIRQDQRRQRNKANASKRYHNRPHRSNSQKACRLLSSDRTYLSDNDLCQHDRYAHCQSVYQNSHESFSTHI